MAAPEQQNSGERWHAVASPILTEDMPAWFDFHFDDIFGDKLTSDKRQEIRGVAHSFFHRYIGIVQQAFPGEIIALTQDEIDTNYRTRVEQALSEDGNAIIIMNDRYICRGIENEHPYNIFRFSSTRMMGNFDNDRGDRKSKIQPRPGDLSFESQMDKIEDKLAEVGRTLHGSRVIIADDVSTSNGTIEDLAEIFYHIGGATVDKARSILNYKIHVSRLDPATDLQNTNGYVERMAVITAEERELYPTGGTTYRVGKTPTDHTQEHIAFQQPAEYPWGDDKMIRTDGFIQSKHLDQLQLQIFRDALVEVAKVLQGTVRKDGTVFEFFTLGDFHYEIPMGPRPTARVSVEGNGKREMLGPFGNFLGPSVLIRELNAAQRMKRTSKGLHELSMTRYLDIALQQLANETNPPITHLVEDLNGTQRQVKFFDSLKRGFRYSQLANIVDSATEQIVQIYNDAPGDNKEFINIKKGDPSHLVVDNQDFARFLVDNYGATTQQKLTQQFVSFYGEQRGPVKLEEYLQECASRGIPYAYHVLRDLTWGEVNLNEAFEPDNGEANAFNTAAVNAGAKLIFLSYSPRIHAMRILESSGQKDLITSGKAVLITVEDLYDPTLHREKKGLVYQTINGNSPSDGAPQSYVFNHLRKKLFNFQALHRTLILGIGNMAHSDIRPAIANGGYGVVLEGPRDLSRLFDYAKFMSSDQARKELVEMPNTGTVFNRLTL